LDKLLYLSNYPKISKNTVALKGLPFDLSFSFRPMWEDDANKYGGRWVINMGRGSKLELDKLWLDVVSILGLCVR